MQSLVRGATAWSHCVADLSHLRTGPAASLDCPSYATSHICSVDHYIKVRVTQSASVALPLCAALIRIIRCAQEPFVVGGEGDCGNSKVGIQGHSEYNSAEKGWIGYDVASEVAPCNADCRHDFCRADGGRDELKLQPATWHVCIISVACTSLLSQDCWISIWEAYRHGGRFGAVLADTES